MNETVEGRRFVYEGKSTSRATPYLYIAGACALVLFAVGGFAFCVSRMGGHHVRTVELHTLTTLPMLIAFGLLSYGVILFRTPRRIELNRKGIILESPLKSVHIPWEEVDSVEWDSRMLMGGTKVETLTLRDGNGVKKAVLSSTVKNFDDLSDRLQRIVTKRTGNKTTSAKARRSKRMAVFLLTFALLTTAGAIFATYSDWSEKLNQQQMQSDGVDVEAHIAKRYMFNNVAPRLTYTFRDAAGHEFTRDTILEKSAWEELAGADNVPVGYVRSNPDYSRLVQGEEPGPQDDFPKFVVGPGLGLMSLLFLTVGILQWKGLDITFDEETRRFRIKRLDEIKTKRKIAVPEAPEDGERG